MISAQLFSIIMPAYNNKEPYIRDRGGHEIIEVSVQI